MAWGGPQFFPSKIKGIYEILDHIGKCSERAKVEFTLE